MNQVARIGCMLGVLVLASEGAPGQDHHTLTGPNLVLEETIGGMPRDDRQSVRIMTVTFKPGDSTPRHTHRFPVVVYVV